MINKNFARYFGVQKHTDIYYNRILCGAIFDLKPKSTPLSLHLLVAPNGSIDHPEAWEIKTKAILFLCHNYKTCLVTGENSNPPPGRYGLQSIFGLSNPRSKLYHAAADTFYRIFEDKASFGQWAMAEKWKNRRTAEITK